MKIEINSSLTLSEDEVQLSSVRSQGAGGQNVNKVATAIHLRFDINGSSLPQNIKQRLLRTKDARITAEGIIIIKAQQYRSQVKNREDAIQRLTEIIQRATITRKKRKATKPSRAAKKKRVDTKTRRGKLKGLRGRVKNE